MPFTPAHIAAVLPLRNRLGLPFAALAAGSMSPDLPYYLPGVDWAPTPATHSVWGVVSWDLAFGVALWAAWCLARDPLFDLAPQPIRARWRRPPSRFSGWRRAPLAVIIGAITHVVWDEFTHADRLGARHLAFLAGTYPSPIGPLEGYRYLQYASGVFGLALLLWVWNRIPTTSPGPRRLPQLAAFAPALVFAGSAAAVAARLAQTSWTGWRAAGFAIVTSGIAGALLATGALCIAHAAFTRAQGEPPAVSWPGSR